MVAFNFKERFASDIEAGVKTSTIRSSMRCKIGDKVQAYTGQRTKNCRKLREGVCTGVAHIRIDDGCPWTILSHIGKVVDTNIGRVHEQEGFSNVREMVDFFREEYGLPYTGYLHKFDWRE